MRAVVVYESMYGNTHLIADAIGDGLRNGNDAEVSVVSVHDATTELLRDADLVVVGGPTHAHGMTRESTRQAARADADKPERELVLDPDAEGPGLRDWFDALGRTTGRAAAFDTRLDAPAALTGRASRGIARKLRHHGFMLVTDPESFFVTRHNHLEPQEAEHAKEWGAHLAGVMASRARA
jgi:hypothetical protein